MANEYSVTFRGTINNQAVQHTRYYRAFTAPSVGEIQAFADTLGTKFITEYASLFNADIRYEDLYIRPNIVGALGASFIPAEFPFNGSSSGEILPPYVTVNVRLRSGGLTFPNKGLVQLPPPVENNQAAGQLTSGALTAYDTAAQMWNDGIPGEGLQMWIPVLWSDTYNAYNDLTLCSVIRVLGSRDSRKYGRGK